VYESGDVYSSDPESPPVTSPPRTNVKPVPPVQRSLPPLPRDAERHSPLSGGGLRASPNTHNKLLPEPPSQPTPAAKRPVSAEQQQTKKTVQPPPPPAAAKESNTLGTTTTGVAASVDNLQNKQATVVASKSQGRPAACIVTCFILCTVCRV